MAAWRKCYCRTTGTVTQLTRAEEPGRPGSRAWHGLRMSCIGYHRATRVSQAYAQHLPSMPVPDSTPLSPQQRTAAAALLAAASVLADELGQIFVKNGHQLALVGGAVRDVFLGRQSGDIDLATDAPPARIIEITEGWPDQVWTIGIDFGTVGMRKGSTIFEITTYRSEQYARRSRKPEVTYGESLEADLSRLPALGDLDPEEAYLAWILRVETAQPRAAIEEAASVRLRPILMTTAAMVVGMAPLIFATGAGAVSRFNIGVTIFAGMAIGTLFTLFVTPAVYTFLARDHAALMAKEKALGHLKEEVEVG